MNRPSALVRFAGYPPVTTLLLIGYAIIVAEWYQGQLAWWLALGAVGAAGKTLRAVRQVRGYKAWLADWHAMGAEEVAAALPKKRRRRGWVFVTGATLLVLAIPFCLPSSEEAGALGNILTVLWCASCLYLVFAVVRGTLRRITGRRKAKAEIAQAKDETAPVAWLMGRASFSPSRADTVRNLPEYCARLIVK